MAIVLGIAGSGEPASAPPEVTITVAPGVIVLPVGARGPLGFKFGPVDGVMGGVKEGPNQYRFFGSGESLNTSACPGTPGVQGAFAFTSNLSTSPPTFTSDCKALVQPSGPLVETGIVGAYDRNYLGGGPAMRVTHPDGRGGVLLVYHSEVQWYNDGPCATGTTLCFYGTLGMAFSSNDGATFQKLGLIIQSHISRATFHTPPFLGGNVPIGNGPFVLGDASGNAVDPRTADPSQTYIYVFYVDNQEDLGTADPCAPSKVCLAVARASLSAVIEAAFAGDGVTLSGLFRKYFNGGFEEPAAPPDPNGTLPTNNAGRYTPILKNAFSPSAVYDATAGQVILATVASAQIQLRMSKNLLDWSQPAVATLAEAAPFAEVRYPSLIGELDDANVAGGAPWLFYSREPPGGTWPQTEFMVASLRVVNSQPPLPVTASVVSAVLPSSRSPKVGTSTAAFATMINVGPSTATGCGIAPMTNIPATFTYHTTNPATNATTGPQNTPVDIPAGAAQSYVFTITPTGSLPPTDVQFSFGCTNASPAPVQTGLNTLLFSASDALVPDIVAVAGTLENDGVVTIPGPSGTGVFSVAMINAGASGTVTVAAHTGAALPVSISLCETNPTTGQCMSATGPSVTTQVDANSTHTFGIFVTGNGMVPFDPAGHRIFVHFKESGTVTRGSTGVAVRTR